MKNFTLFRNEKTAICAVQRCMPRKGILKVYIQQVFVNKTAGVDCWMLNVVVNRQHQKLVYKTPS